MTAPPVGVRCTIVVWFLNASALFAKVISPDQPVPRTTSPPVVFVNGYQNDCGNSSFANTFGIADQVLHASGNLSLYFNNCTVAGKSSIERLGTSFGAFLSSLKYDQGSAANLFNVV